MVSRLYASNEAVLWCENYASEPFKQVIELLASTDTEIKGVYFKSPPKTKISLTYPILSEAELSNTCPFVYGHINSEALDFDQAMTWCNEHGYRLLHLAACILTVEHPTPLGPRIKTYGFPGSGNMLMQQFIQDFLPEPLYSDIERLHVQTAFDYLSKTQYYLEPLVKQTFCDFSFETNNFIYSNLNEHEGRLIVYTDDLKQIATINNFPLLSIIWDRVSVTHGYPTPSSIDFHKKKNYKQIVIQRNPIDTIYAFMHKSILKDSPFVLDLFLPTSYFYSEFLKQTLISLATFSDVLLIKYEDLTKGKLETYQALAKHCNYTISDDTITRWIHEHINKPLPIAMDLHHFKGGGEKKWTSVFSKDCYAALERLGTLEFASQFGYKIDASDFNGDASVYSLCNNLDFIINQTGFKSLISDGNLNFWSSSDRYKQLTSDLGVNIQLSSTFPNNINFISSTKQLEDKFLQCVDACFFQKPKEVYKLPPLESKEFADLAGLSV